MRSLIFYQNCAVRILTIMIKIIIIIIIIIIIVIITFFI